MAWKTNIIFITLWQLADLKMCVDINFIFKAGHHAVSILLQMSVNLGNLQKILLVLSVITSPVSTEFHSTKLRD